MMMCTINSIRRTVRWSAAFALVWLAAAPVWAQEAEESSSTGAKWGMAYALVFLGIILGVFAVCRPGRRSKEIRRIED